MADLHKLALVIPYRDREEHLRLFLPHINRYLDERQIVHRVYLIEQTPGRLFNKGVLLNAAFLEADRDCDYFVFHDVDMLPVDVDYSYNEAPTHLTSSASQYGYELPYAEYFGGAVLFSRNAFQQANGYSNEYWGWGAEDDDMLLRCQLAGMQVVRKNPGIFKSLHHERIIVQAQYGKNLYRFQQMQSGNVDWKSEGVNSCQYRVISRVETPEMVRMEVSV